MERCKCEWCQPEPYRELGTPESMLTCSGPFDDSDEMHAFALEIIRLRKRVAELEGMEKR